MRRGERQREHLLAGALGDRERRLRRVPLAEPRQCVDGEEVDARRDPLVGEGALVVVAGRARGVGSDADGVQMQGMGVARIACERRDALEADEPVVVLRELARPDLGVVLDPVFRQAIVRGRRRGSP